MERATALLLRNDRIDRTLAVKEYAQSTFSWRELLGLADRLDVRLVDNPPPRVTLH